VNELWTAMGFLLEPGTLLLAVIGFLVGGVGGAIPGIGAPLTLALMVPFTLGLEPAGALVLLIGAYSGSAYAGSIPSILINTPGTPSSAAAALDGYPLARQGQATMAISVSATASALGSLLGGIFLILALPVLVLVVLKFGSVEFLMLAVVGLITIALASSGSMRKGILAGAVGALLGAIGSTNVAPAIRFNMGFIELSPGIAVVPAFIGVFAVAEMLRLAGESNVPKQHLKAAGSRLRGVQETLKHWVIVIRSSIIGIVCGIVPGEGGTVGSFLSYLDAKRSSSEPERYGQGHPGGIVAVEASNNSVISGALVPTLAFGIPGNATTAILLGALLLQGVQPGPEMLGDDIGITYVIIGAILIGALLSFVLGVSLAGSFSAVTQVPNQVLIPAVLAVSLTAAYVAHFNFFDVIVAVVFGAIGFALIKYGYSIIAFVMGLLLGPLAETNLYRTYLLGDGDVLGQILGRPIAVAIGLLGILLLAQPLLGPVIARARTRRREQAVTR
jgi:putative tricarboxylic transport membrane protein